MVSVRVRSRKERARLLQRIHAGGYATVDDVAWPFAGEIATVVAEVELTWAHREMIPVLLRHDRAAAMAEEFGCDEDGARARLHHLATRLGVHSRHRLVARLLEYGLLRIEVAPRASRRLRERDGVWGEAEGSSEEDDVPKIQVATVALRVHARQPEHGSRLAEWLWDGGDPVMADDRRPFLIQVAGGDEAGLLTTRRREVIGELLNHDHAKEMAHSLGIQDKTVYDHLKGLMDELEVGSWHRLVVRLVEEGWLIAERST